MSRNLLRTWLIVLGFLVVQNLSVRWDIGNDESSEESYQFLKRLFFNKNPASSSPAPSVLDNLVKSTARPSTPMSVIFTGKSTNSPFYPSTNPCSSNPCDNSGICYPKGQNSFECRCVGPWRGLYCGIRDACYRSPCLNGGTCLNVHDDYFCQCPSTHHGLNCEYRYNNPNPTTDVCRPNICNTGRCVPLQTTYYCACPDDRYGEHCEKRFSKRKVSNRRSYYDLLHELKRTMKHDPKSFRGSDHGEDVAVYDAKNGIYF